MRRVGLWVRRDRGIVRRGKRGDERGERGGGEAYLGMRMHAVDSRLTTA